MIILVDVEIDTSDAISVIEEALNEVGTDEEEDALWASASSPMTAEDWKAALEVCESL